MKDNILVTWACYGNRCNSFGTVSFCTRYGLPEPIYVNLVRDPIERVISWYYYVRAPWYYVERKQAFPDIPLPDPHWLKKVSVTCPCQ